MEKVPCRPLRCDLSAEWEVLKEAFAKMPVAVLRQDWQPRTNLAYRKGVARVAYRDGRLVVYAELDDEDVFNPATRFNDPVRNKGDFFEIIVQPVRQDVYYEVHVTPNHQRSQSRWPGAAEDVPHGAGPL